MLQRACSPFCSPQRKIHQTKSRQKSQKRFLRKTKKPWNRCDSKVFLIWRGREDLNLRDAFYTSYSLSRGAPSASWVLPQVDGKFSWRREWDSNPRMLSHRRFSRPVPSTARPSLRVVSPRLSLKRGLYHTIPRRCLSTVPREFFAFSRISAQRRCVWRMMR